MFRALMEHVRQGGSRSRLRGLFAAVATGVIASTVLAAPVAAVDGESTIWIAHGIPGATVDVCVNGAEARSEFKYGQRFRAQLPDGTYNIRVRAAAPGCSGPVVIRYNLELSGPINATALAVVKGGAPQLVIWVNDLTTPTPAVDGLATVTVTHEAKAPAVDVYLARTVVLPAVFTPEPTVADFTRGEQAGPVPVDGGAYAFWATVADARQPVIGPTVRTFVPGYGYQVIAVGTNPGNYRFIVFRNPLQAVS